MGREVPVLVSLDRRLAVVFLVAAAQDDTNLESLLSRVLNRTAQDVLRDAGVRKDDTGPTAVDKLLRHYGYRACDGY